MKDNDLIELIDTDRQVISSIVNNREALIPSQSISAPTFTVFRIFKISFLYLLLFFSLITVKYYALKTLDHLRPNSIHLPQLDVFEAEYEGSINLALRRVIENEKNY